MDPSLKSRIVGIVPTVLRGYWGERLTASIGLVFDLLTQASADAIRAPWVGSTGGGPAPDVHALAGAELLLPQYPTETNANFLQRLARAWQDWQRAGDETTLLAQLATAGWPGSLLLTPHELPSADPVGYWSQFWLLWPAGTHPVIAEAKTWDSFYFDDGTVYDAQGITASQIMLIKLLVRKFKPAHWICRSLIFVVDGWSYDDGHNWDDPGLTFDGVTVVTPGF